MSLARKGPKTEWSDATWRDDPEPLADVVVDDGGDHRLVDWFVLSGSVPAEFHWRTVEEKLPRPRIDVAIEGGRVRVTAENAPGPMELRWDGSVHAFRDLAGAVTSLAQSASGHLPDDKKTVALALMDAVDAMLARAGLTANAYQIGAREVVARGDDHSIAPALEVVRQQLERRLPDWRESASHRSHLKVALRARLAGATEQQIRWACELVAPWVGVPAEAIWRDWQRDSL